MLASLPCIEQGQGSLLSVPNDSPGADDRQQILKHCVSGCTPVSSAGREHLATVLRKVFRPKNQAAQKTSIIYGGESACKIDPPSTMLSDLF